MSALVTMMRSPEVMKRLGDDGSTAVESTHEDFRALILRVFFGLGSYGERDVRSDVGECIGSGDRGRGLAVMLLGEARK